MMYSRRHGGSGCPERPIGQNVFGMLALRSSTSGSGGPSGISATTSGIRSTNCWLALRVHSPRYCRPLGSEVLMSCRDHPPRVSLYCARVLMMMRFGTNWSAGNRVSAAGDVVVIKLGIVVTPTCNCVRLCVFVYRG